MALKIALAGNPNCGKTTLFNSLTGSNQYVGNWPGVTVEKKEGKLKGHKDVKIVDLPGIYSLSPYTLEEVVARNYLVNEKPDAIINIIDGSNIERNLYLSTQLIELGIPVIMAINMMDVVEKNGDKINVNNLSKNLGCEVVTISALKNKGISAAADLAVKVAQSHKLNTLQHRFADDVEKEIESVVNKLPSSMPTEQKKFFAIKLIERDSKIEDLLSEIPNVEQEIKNLEEKFDDDTESIITNERYEYISSIIDSCVKKGKKGKDTVSDKIDRIVTNRFLALPIFALIMFIVYGISVTKVGSPLTDWTNDNLLGDDGWNLLHFGPHIPGVHAFVGDLLESVKCASWLSGLINDGIIAGVCAVLGFVPQIMLLFFFLALLESCGYMSRVAFIMDRIFRKFGLSGKSFIPMLIGSGCGVPGVMASRTIENERDRRMTIMTTTFIPCSAKLPIIALIAGAFFHNSALVSVSAYFIGIAAIVCSGIILKKTKMFAGDPAPFVMELPAYHMPTLSNVFRSMGERGWSFIKKAGTIILLSTIAIWFLQTFGWDSKGNWGMLEADQIDGSVLAKIGGVFAFIFKPLGFGNWRMAVAAITGLIAKENVIATIGMTYGIAELKDEAGADYWHQLAISIPAIAGYAYLVFNLLCAPCFAAMGAIKREMNNTKWFLFAIGYQCGLAYAVSLVIYQIGGLFTGNVSFGFGTIVSIVLVAYFIYLLVRPYKESNVLTIKTKSLAK
ncbi:ferrous iron transport protein B [Lachnobacterium bovis]|uniref:ferrous iron transport protein B n=1 Tax=Lachnobacterium bovis TaxID=140626 RepID=UPI000481A09A|nr:ferrous iron transport protein B [Lachnobacterium bovis]